MQRIDWGTYYNKLFVAGIAGRAPELFILHTSSLRRFAEAGFLRPLDDLARTYPTGDLDKSVWQAAHIDNKVVGLPVDIHMLGMFYNKKLLREAGYDTPPTNREQFVDALKKITKGQDGADKIWGFGISGASQTALSMMWQWGGGILRPTTPVRSRQRRKRRRTAIFGGFDPQRQNGVAARRLGSWVAFRQGRVA